MEKNDWLINRVDEVICHQAKRDSNADVSSVNPSSDGNRK